MAIYKHIFFDLDRTLWDFESNMRLTLSEIYSRHNLSRHIGSAEQFIESFVEHNTRLWACYQRGELKKEILRYKRFDLTLREFGVKDKILASVIGNEYIEESPKKTILIPYTIDVLDYLCDKYKMHIITNGFNEVQFTKLKLCGIEKYFDRVITSEIAGYHKPRPEAFSYALSSANARKSDSIMVGDDMEADILGAKQFGMNQVYFNPSRLQHAEQPTHEVDCLLKIKEIL